MLAIPWVQVDPAQPGGYTKQAMPLEEKRKAMPAFVAASPRGLVPAIQHAGLHASHRCQLCRCTCRSARHCAQLRLDMVYGRKHSVRKVQMRENRA